MHMLRLCTKSLASTFNRAYEHEAASLLNSAQLQAYSSSPDIPNSQESSACDGYWYKQLA